jgi:hypothetical protein
MHEDLKPDEIAALIKTSHHDYTNEKEIIDKLISDGKIRRLSDLLS